MPYISYSSSDEYSEYTGISLLSMLENNQDWRIDGIFLLNNGIQERNLQKIYSIASQYKVPLTIIEIDEILQSYCEANSLQPFSGSYSTYARLIPDQIYPDYVDKVLVIDSDTVVSSSLKDFPFCEMENVVLAAVDNPEMHMPEAVLSEAEKNSLICKGFYLNCGIVAYNLKAWRQRKISSRILKELKRQIEVTYAEQTILNLVMEPEDVLRIPLKYNAFFHGYPRYLRYLYIKKYASLYSKEEICESIDSPVIIHYKGSDMRPWFDCCTSNRQKTYLSYKAISPWADVPLREVYSDTFSKKKFAVKKAVRNSPLMVPWFFIKKSIVRKK